jgi:hypothetical protein
MMLLWVVRLGFVIVVAVSVTDERGSPREALREAAKQLMERVCAMILNQSAVLELSEVLRSADAAGSG